MNGTKDIGHRTKAGTLDGRTLAKPAFVLCRLSFVPEKEF